MANSDYDREREIDEIGRDKVASNNKKHAMNVKKRKEELAKKVGGSKTFMGRIADKAAKSDKERTGQSGRAVEAMFDKHFGKKK